MADLTTSALLRRNTVHNLLGEVLPLLAAVVAVPVLIDRLGAERFGVLMLVLGIVAASGLLDLGLGRAVTHLVSLRLGGGRTEAIPGLVRAAWLAMAGVGLLLAAALAAATPWLAHELVEPELAEETRRCLWLLAFAIPCVLPTSVFRGVLEAYQRFAAINIVRIPVGFLTYAAPLVVALLGGGLVAVVVSLVMVRAAALAGFVALASRVLPAPAAPIEPMRRHWGELLAFGGWVTVSNLAAPIILYTDRFVIGVVLSSGAVAFYATPFEVLSRLWIVPGALAGVLLPAFSFVAAGDRRGASRLHRYALAIVFGVMLPPTLAAAAFAEPLLTAWLGTEFAAHSTRPAQWLAAAVFLNALGQLPLTLIQGIGRPDVSAILHGIEVPLYLAALWAGVRLYGIEGAAAVWFLRSVVDTAALLLLADRLTATRPAAFPAVAAATAVALATFYLVAQLPLPVAAAIVAAVTAALAAVALRHRRMLWGGAV